LAASPLFFDRNVFEEQVDYKPSQPDILKLKFCNTANWIELLLKLSNLTGDWLESRLAPAVQGHGANP